MARVAVTPKESVLEQTEQLRRRIERRAYELFRQRDGLSGDAAADWLSAERELVWKPAVELREADGTFTVVVALPDIEAKNVSVEVSAEDVVIKAASSYASSDTKGQVRERQAATAELFRSVHLPKPAVAAKARAEYQNGLLIVTIPAAAPVPAKRTARKAS